MIRYSIILLLLPSVHNFMFDLANSIFRQYIQHPVVQPQAQYQQPYYTQSHQDGYVSNQVAQAPQQFAPPQQSYANLLNQYARSPNQYAHPPVEYAQPPAQYVKPSVQYVRPPVQYVRPPQYVQPPQYVRPTPPPDPCFTNEHGFRCCNRNLLDLMNEVSSEPQRRRQFEACNQQKLANEMAIAAQKRFNTSFESIVSRSEIVNKGRYRGDMMCKTLAPNGKHILLYATPVPYTTEEGASRPLTEEEIALSSFPDIYQTVKDLPTNLLFNRLLG